MTMPIDDRDRLLGEWAGLREQATELRRLIRIWGCELACEPEYDERGQVTYPGDPRCTEGYPDEPARWCDPCEARTTARAEIAAVKWAIRSVERKILRRVRKATEQVAP